MVEFNITTVGTPPRDVELFGKTTVRIDRRRTDEIAGVPVLYLSAYVADDAAFAEKVVAALAWVTDGTVSAARAGDVPNKPSPEAAAVVANELQAVTLGIHLVGLNRLPEVMNANRPSPTGEDSPANKGEGR